MQDGLKNVKQKIQMWTEKLVSLEKEYETVMEQRGEAAAKWVRKSVRARVRANSGTAHL